MTVIIGIDPGSRRTGYGVIRTEGNRIIYLASGCLNLTNYQPAERLRQIFLGIQTLINDYQPEEAAIEQVFMHVNPNSALKLGQARGAAMAALSMPTAEYSARVVKKSVVGYGAATKEQVQFMIQKLLNLSSTPITDAADALAIALCHGVSRHLQRLGAFS